MRKTNVRTIKVDGIKVKLDIDHGSLGWASCYIELGYVHISVQIDRYNNNTFKIGDIYHDGRGVWFSDDFHDKLMQACKRIKKQFDKLKKEL